MVETKRIYIVLSDTGSMFTRAIRLYTRQTYNHTSLSLGDSFEKMYSFGRRKPTNPFIGGFINEHETHIYEYFEDTSCVVMKLDVSDDAYQRIEAKISQFDQDKELLRYNLFGFVGFLVHLPIKRRNAYFCSQFVHEILKESGVEIFEKPSELALPSDFLNWARMEKVYQGKFKDLGELRLKTSNHM